MARLTPAKLDEALLQRREQAPGLGVGVSDNQVRGHHDARLRQLCGRTEAAAIHRQRRHECIGGEVRGEGEGQAEPRGQARAEVARPQDPDRHVRVRTGHGADALAGGK